MRLVFEVALSSPMTAHPKLLAGLLIHPCTSPVSCAVGPKVAAPKEGTVTEALLVEEKSPPGLVHNWVLNLVWIQVASLVVAAAPCPPEGPALDVPSPQS